MHATKNAIVRQRYKPRRTYPVAPFVTGGVISGSVPPVLIAEGVLAVLPPGVVMFPALLPGTVLNVKAGHGGIGEVPTAVAGIAEPTPLLVNGVGKGKVEVFGSSIVSPS